jgi:hypothetical protein
MTLTSSHMWPMTCLEETPMGTCTNFNKRGPNPKHNQQWNKKIVQRKHANSSKQLQHKTNYKHEHKTKWNAKWKIENLKHVAKNSHLNNLSTKTLVHLHCCKFQPYLTSILQWQTAIKCPIPTYLQNFAFQELVAPIKTLKSSLFIAHKYASHIS